MCKIFDTFVEFIVIIMYTNVVLMNELEVSKSIHFYIVALIPFYVYLLLAILVNLWLYMRYGGKKSDLCIYSSFNKTTKNR